MLTAIDTETTLTSAAEPVPRLVCVSIAGASGCGLFHVDDPAARSAVRAALATGAVFCNAAFDLAVIWRAWPDLLPEIFDALEHDRVTDVSLRAKLLDIAVGMLHMTGGYSLRAMASRWCGYEIAKGEDTWRMRYAELLPYPVAYWPADAIAYASADAAATLGVWLAQEAAPIRLRWPTVLADQYRQTRADFALFLQGLRGIETDPIQVAAVGRRLNEDIAHQIGKCMVHGLARLEGVAKPRVVRSQKKAADMLEAYCIETAQRVPRSEKKERVSLSEPALAELHIAPTHPLHAYRELGSLTTQRTGWMDPLSHPRVYTNYDSLRETGRTSSGGFGEDAPWAFWSECSRNLQNFPQDGGYRECLVPGEGRAFLVSDWSGAELVTFAQAQLDLFGRSALADVIAAGRDAHAEFASTIIGAPYDASNPAHKPIRKLAKAWNFGKPGGMGAARFIRWALSAYGVEITESQEAKYTKLYKRQWPEVQPFFDATKRLADIDGRITIVLPRSGRVRGGCGFTDGCNTQFQGPASDAAKDTLWRLLRAQYDPRSPMFGGLAAMRDPNVRPDVYQALFVHDENVTVAPLARAADCVAEQARIMVDTFRRWCPQVPIKTEDHVLRERYMKV